MHCSRISIAIQHRYEYLIAHHKSWDPLYFITKFVDGLHYNIIVVVMVWQPKDLYSVVSLATLQEEALEVPKEMMHSGLGASCLPRSQCTVLPLSPPPVGRPPALSTGGRAEDKRDMASTQVPSTDDKIQALRAYRQAHGLCYTCSERWAHDHKCAVLLYNFTSWRNCLVSDVALQGVEPPLTMHLWGVVQQQEVLMLVDSGSMHNFIRESLAAYWPRVQRCRPMHVKVANRGMLRCDLATPHCAWEAQGV
jgi:hypothetical protein